MVQLNFNAQAVQPNAAPEAIPTGQYPVIITASQKKPTKAGDGSYVELEMTVQGGEFANRKLFDRLNIENKNQTAVDIAYATLSAICHVTGRLHIQDTAQLHGVPFIAVVQKKERNDQPGTMTNEVKGYKDMNGNDPGHGGQVAQTNAQPAWAQNGGGQPQNGGQPAWAGNNQQPQNNAQPQNQQPQGGYNGQPQGQGGQPQYDQNANNGGQPQNNGNGNPPAWNGNGQGQQPQNQQPQNNGQSANGAPSQPIAGQAPQQDQNNGGPSPAAGPAGAAANNGDAPPWARTA